MMSRDPVVLIPLIRRQLADDLLLPHQRDRPRRTNSAGHCYVASEALWHLTGRRFHVLQIWHEDNSHWFLRDPDTSEIYDPTADQFIDPVPYDEARRRPFRTSRPSRRAMILIGRIAIATQTGVTQCET
jgi:hypothetical protein